MTAQFFPFETTVRFEITVAFPSFQRFSFVRGQSACIRPRPCSAQARSTLIRIHLGAQFDPVPPLPPHFSVLLAFVKSTLKRKEARSFLPFWRLRSVKKVPNVANK